MSLFPTSSLRTDSANPVRIIRSDLEALDVAKALAAKFKVTASQRDRAGAAPLEEVDEITRSGLLAIQVPRTYGGAGANNTTLVRVLQALSSADGSLGQIHQNHFNFAYSVVLNGTSAQKGFYLGEILRGARLGNCLAEREGRHGLDSTTRITPSPDGTWRLNGEKYYSTGAFLAHWLPVAAKDHESKPAMVYVGRHGAGVEVINDWDGMGQRNTVSGTAIFRDVIVTNEQILRVAKPTHAAGSHAQLMHAAIDVGLAKGSLDDIVWFTRDHARPHADFKQAGDEPYQIKHFGELRVLYAGAEALVLKAAKLLDEAFSDLDNEEKGRRAAIAVAEARALSDRAALKIASDLFEFGGTRASDEKWNLHLHWRNARTHTLHDPVRWRLHHVGNYFLNGVPPPLGRRLAPAESNPLVESAKQLGERVQLPLLTPLSVGPSITQDS
jgi:SfnB family sulfur acquisition oxidoreductase